MKELTNILRAYRQNDFSKTRAALATVIGVGGSSYRRPGARMFILEDGHWIGGISGGCLEGDALHRAKHAMIQNTPTVVTYDTTERDAHQIGVGLGCEGVIEVLIAPLRPDDASNPLEILSQCMGDRKANVLLTVTKTGGDFANGFSVGDMVKFKDANAFSKNFPDKRLSKEVLKDIRKVLEFRKSKTVSYALSEKNRLEFFIEYFPPATHLVLFGSQYDLYPLVGAGKATGWKVTVVGHLSKLDKSLFSTADAVLPQKTAKFNPDEFTALILMAHDYKTDYKNLKKAIRSAAPYIGVLGPKKRTERMFGDLKKEGVEFPDGLSGRIHAPVGLDIGATTPEEIAIAIIAEIRAFFGGREGGFLKHREGPIHSIETTENL